ncbi:MAG: hypothetical protein PHH59_15355 [Methylovulum sp.]|uniref:hypothetical protein n=1 Tax=Methylovulum sp. TaxID=1916980 RepID=UPI00260CD7E0|nr:hypothetical protein [Methylovulum sp.]MDD2725382.1 hypothetical protein [Methylovulum sp.]MDD5125547.1 hypothetical protein [Methylovulum sp.]
MKKNQNLLNAPAKAHFLAKSPCPALLGDIRSLQKSLSVQSALPIGKIIGQNLARIMNGSNPYLHL